MNFEEAKYAVFSAIETEDRLEHDTLIVCEKALDKQIKQKVNNRKVLRDFEKRPYETTGDCPSCGFANLRATLTDFCNACGQKIDFD